MDDFERMGAILMPVESPALSNLKPEELAPLPREGYLSLIAVADAQTMRDHTVLFMDDHGPLAYKVAGTGTPGGSAVHELRLSG